jgi:4-hydroxy-tetrahydrodipicolinate synthase
VPGIIILGTTGEFLTISDEERRLYVEATVKHVAGRMDVLVGTMNAHTPKAVRYSREAEELGADGLMIIPPYYYTPTEDEIFNYYRAISEAVSIPIMLYNNPVTSNVDMPAKLVARMTEAFENVRYIKEASMDVARVHDIVEATNGVMNVFAGERIVESFLLGAVGYVNPYGNYIPHASSRIWDLLCQGRLEEAKAIQRVITRLDHIIAEGHRPMATSVTQRRSLRRRVIRGRCAPAAYHIRGIGRGGSGPAGQARGHHARTRFAAWSQLEAKAA